MLDPRLIDRAQKVYDFIVKESCDGNSPSMHEIRVACGTGSLSVVSLDLTVLEFHNLIVVHPGLGDDWRIQIAGVE